MTNSSRRTEFIVSISKYMQNGRDNYILVFFLCRFVRAVCLLCVWVASRSKLIYFDTTKKAAEIFEEAQEGGKGFCGTYPEEEAELYVEQFTRCEPIIYADMEKEGVQKGAQDGAGA